MKGISPLVKGQLKFIQWKMNVPSGNLDEPVRTVVPEDNILR
jgi:hypothetical protein